MKKIIAILLTALLVLGITTTFTSCTQPRTTKSLTMGFDADFPPYGYEKDGEYVGFDIEYAKKVCANLGYSLTLKAIDWDAKDELLKSGAIDFIWNGFTYEGREDKYEWTERYLNNSIVVLTTDSSITTLAGLAGKKVAVQSDSSGEAALNSEDNEELVASFDGGAFATEAQYVTACEKLKSGAYDAIVVDYGVAKYLQGQNAGLIIVDEAVSQETYAVGFLKGNTELCAEINAELIKVGKDETFIKGLCEKYEVDYSSFLLK